MDQLGTQSPKKFLVLSFYKVSNKLASKSSRSLMQPQRKVLDITQMQTHARCSYYAAKRKCNWKKIENQ